MGGWADSNVTYLNIAIVIAPMKSDMMTIAVTIVNTVKNRMVITYRWWCGGPGGLELALRLTRVY